MTLLPAPSCVLQAGAVVRRCSGRCCFQSLHTLLSLHNASLKGPLTPFVLQLQTAAFPSETTYRNTLVLRLPGRAWERNRLMEYHQRAVNATQAASKQAVSNRGIESGRLYLFLTFNPVSFALRQNYCASMPAHLGQAGASQTTAGPARCSAVLTSVPAQSRHHPRPPSQ